MKIVTIGCGTGHSVIIKGFVDSGIKPTAIVAVTDNGGHSGELRKQLAGLPAVGDLRQCMSALMHDSAIKATLDFRFNQAELKGVSAGNTMLAAAFLSYGSLAKAAIKLCKAMKCQGLALPATDASIQIGAETETGKKIIGEHDVINRQPKEKIKDFFLSPDAAAAKEALRAIRRADAIIIAPGVLMSIAGILLAKGISEAINKSSAQKILVCNIMSHPSQPEIVSASQNLGWLQKYINLDFVIVNNGAVDKDVLEFYGKIGARQTEIDDPNNIKFIAEDVVEKAGLQEALAKERSYSEKMQRTPHLIRHNGKKVAEVILQKLIDRKT